MCGWELSRTIEKPLPFGINFVRFFGFQRHWIIQTQFNLSRRLLSLSLWHTQQKSLSQSHTHSLTHARNLTLTNVNFSQWLFMPIHLNCYQSTASHSARKALAWWWPCYRYRTERELIEKFLRYLLWLCGVRCSAQKRTVKRADRENTLSSYLAEINVLTACMYCSARNRRQFVWQSPPHLSVGAAQEFICIENRCK